MRTDAQNNKVTILQGSLRFDYARDNLQRWKKLFKL